MSRVTIRTIADLAGVSIGTVDRVLNKRGEVSEKTRERILKIVKDLNYAPDFLASHLASKKAKVIAFLLPAVTDDTSFWKGPLDGIVQAVNEYRHYNIQLRSFHFNQFDENSFEQGAAALLGAQPDGAIVVPFFPKSASLLTAELSRKSVPCVFINTPLDDAQCLSFVGQDSFRSGYLAAKLMAYGLEAGRNILVANIYRAISGHKHIQARMDGFKKYFDDNPEHKAVISEADIQETDLNEIIRQLHQSYRKADHLAGIFVTSSRVYMAAKFLVRHNIHGIRLIGYDLIPENIPYLEDGIIDFLINQRPFEQGYKAVTALVNYLMLKRLPESAKLLPLDIITRENIKDYQ